MDDVRTGSLYRAARLKRSWRQCDVADKAGVSRARVSLLECGHLDRLRMGEIRAIARALEVDVDLRSRWRGGEGERMLSARHAGLAEAMVRLVLGDAWEPHPEASFSIWGERGVIDILAWHPATRTLLVIEIKTEIVDVAEMLGTLDRKHRLAREVAAGLGLDPVAVGVCVVLLESSTNHRRLAEHVATIRAALPADGRRLRAWLRHPSGPIAGLMFLAVDAKQSSKQDATGRKRVRVPRTAPADLKPGAGPAMGRAASASNPNSDTQRTPRAGPASGGSAERSRQAATERTSTRAGRGASSGPGSLERGGAGRGRGEAGARGARARARELE